MKTKQVAACLATLGALCVSAAMASTATAALPEYGHCTAKAGGKYTGSTCTTLAKTAKTMKFEFTPIEGSELIEGGGVGSTIKFQPAGHPVVTCVSLSINTKWLTSKTASAKWILRECSNAIHQSCESGTESGVIEPNPLEGELAYVKAIPPQLVGFDFKPATPLASLFSYSCGGSTETGTVEGSVIARVKPINKMTREQDFIISAPRGEQFPTAFEGGATDTLTTKFLPANTTAPTTMSVKSFVGATTALNGEPELELKAL
jgi:hypothetical protein